MLSNRNCFKLLVKMISASPIARCPSFKFLTRCSLSHLGRGIADRSIRDHHVRRQARTASTDECAQRFRALTPNGHSLMYINHGAAFHELLAAEPMLKLRSMKRQDHE